MCKNCPETGRWIGVTLDTTWKPKTVTQAPTEPATPVTSRPAAPATPESGGAP